MNPNILRKPIDPEVVALAEAHGQSPQNANNLTIAALDPVAKIPEYKVCAVRLERVNL